MSINGWADVGQIGDMIMQRLLAVAWQFCRALFMLEVGLYMARHFMADGRTSSPVSQVACSLMFLGGVANVVVVLLNRGKMPVRIDEVLGRRRFSYEPMNGRTRLRYLGDCIRIAGWHFSPGDICLYGGLALMAGGVVLPHIVR